jgi:hypothetical protein
VEFSKQLHKRQEIGTTSCKDFRNGNVQCARVKHVLENFRQ